MKTSARLSNSEGRNEVTLKTNEHEHALGIPPKASGFGSSANGGELLCLALATCFCNDLYREAARRGVIVEAVDVEVEGEFGAEGEPARSITYRAHVDAQASETQLRDLIAHTDRVAEIQKTLRQGALVTLLDSEPASRT